MYFQEFPIYNYYNHLKSIDSFLGISGSLWGAVVAMLGVIATVILGFLAIFGEQVRKCLFKPNIQAVDGKKTEQLIGNDTYIFQRFIVKNSRKNRGIPYQAKDVRVLLTYRNLPKNNNFIPIPLRWTHFNKSPERNIPPDENIYVDVLYQKKGENKYKFCWAPGTSSEEPELSDFNCEWGDIRLEFFDENGAIGDIYLRYDLLTDILKKA